MDGHTLRVLEFPVILEHLAAEAASVLGRERAAALLPTGDEGLVAERLAQTRECRDLLGQGPFPRLERATDIRPALGRAAIAGSRLAPEELLAVADTLEAAGALRRHVQAAGLDLARLRRLAAALSPLPDLTTEIRRCLAPDGVVLDSASPVLSRLRAEARRTREVVRETLQGLVTSPALQPIIVEPVITLRNDRYVIPVTPGYRAHLPGVVQDQSGSGHTLFLEPLAVVELNNAIRRLEREAEDEVDRILLELTGRVRAAAEAAGQTVEAFAELDLILAKARLAERWRAAEPRLTAKGRLQLRAVRHPLLLEARRDQPSEESVVPIDVAFGSAARVLVITGPNTGGKSVALKSVGLAAVMTQAGLHIPASPDSEVPAYDTVFADIGDEQSIAQDLSTFSAHVVRLRTLLSQVGPRSLVLVDEIGAGTDPGEGAALGCAILEELASRGCHVVATTHLDAIKAFVATDPRMMNAAVEFDLDRLRPLYKLHIGLPGRSFAIDVAYRLGIPPTIIQRSRELLGDSGAEVAALLGRLQVMEERRRVGVAEAARDREAAAASRQTAERLAADLRLEVAAIRAKAGRLVTEIAAEARRRAEATVADLRRGGGIRQAREAIHDLAQLPETRLEGVVGDREGPRDEGLAAPSRVEPGQRVRIRHLDQVGTVLSEANSQGVVEVQLPVGKTRVPLESLIVVGELSRHSIGGVTWTAGAGDALAPEINVIGCTVEEATGRVQQYIEDAVLGGLSQVRIIHGKGTGRLRKGLAEFLKGHPLVAGFHLASFEEGGAGATIVQLGPCEAGGTAGGVHPSASVRTG
jgi:DNA mismatch repair protein MutS2